MSFAIVLLVLIALLACVPIFWKYTPDLTYPTLPMLPMYYFRDLGPSTSPDTPGALARQKIQAWFDSAPLPRPQPEYRKDSTTYRFVLNGHVYELGGSWSRLSLGEASPTITYVGTGAQIHCATNTVGKWIWHMIHNKLVRGTCVSVLPMFDHHLGFNFGQEQDQIPIHLVCEELIKRNPKCKLVMFGGCKGASVLLQTLSYYGRVHKEMTSLKYSSSSNNPYAWIDHVVALVCESPILSVRKFMRWQLGGKMAMELIDFWFSNGSHHHSLLDIKDFPSHFPCLIGGLPHNKLSTVGDNLEMAKVMNGFTKTKNTRVWISKNTALVHGQLSKDPEYWAVLQDF